MKYFKDRLFYGAISLVSLGILLKTYQYLTKLENCDCFNNAHAYNSLKVNVDFLKAYQIIITNSVGFNAISSLIMSPTSNII